MIHHQPSKYTQQQRLSVSILLFLLLSGLSGCSTIWSKTSRAPDVNGDHQVVYVNIGRPWTGIALNLEFWRCYGRWSAENKGLYLLAPVVVPLLVIDLPLSAAADAIFWPIDLANSPGGTRGKQSACAEQ